jgi:hypothetical protein
MRASSLKAQSLKPQSLEPQSLEPRASRRQLGAWSVRLAAAVFACACGAGSGGIGAVSCSMPASSTRASNAPAPGSEMPRSVLDPYLKIQSALAEDSMDGVKANAGDIATAASSLGAAAAKLATAAVRLAAANDLDTGRDAFGALSLAIDNYMRDLKMKAPEGVRVAFCPMAQKPWLQEGSAIENPYYGKSMQTCGSFR